MTVEEKPAAPLTIDDIHTMLTEIARDPDSGADKFRALKMLASAGQANVTLPEPMDEAEKIERVSRILKALGRERSQLAYQAAWPQANTTIDSPARATLDDLPADIRYMAQQIKSLKQFYRAFPERKQGGYPKGFPMGRSTVLKALWCQAEAAKVYLDRRQMAVQPNDPAQTASE